MDSDDDTFDNENVDSGNVSSGDDDFGMEVDLHNNKERQTELDDYIYEVLTTDQIVQHMVDSIKDVNTVVEVSGSLNESHDYVQHFWEIQKNNADDKFSPHSAYSNTSRNNFVNFSFYFLLKVVRHLNLMIVCTIIKSFLSNRDM